MATESRSVLPHFSVPVLNETMIPPGGDEDDQAFFCSMMNKAEKTDEFE